MMPGMNQPSASAQPPTLDLDRLRQGARSIRHPLTRALLALTFTTGLVDAVSYLGLGRVFTANMTGNIVLLGFGIVGAGGLPVVAPVVSLVSFLVGAVAAGVVAATTVRRENASAYLVIALVASAMGVRNAAVRRFAVPDLTTTVL